MRKNWRRWVRNVVPAAALAGALAVSPLAAQEEKPAADRERPGLFNKLDANADGVVGPDEVDGEAKALFERLLRRADKNDDGKLSREEFAAGTTEQPPQPRRVEQAAPDRPAGRPERFTPVQLSALFERTDANSDGKVAVSEMREELREPLRRLLDREGIDAIDKEQFIRFMTMIQEQGPDRPSLDRPSLDRPRPDQPRLAQPGRPGEPRPDLPPGRRPDAPPGDRPPMGRPLIAVLDGDGDGELSAAEIDGAGKALLALDRNEDGKLTRDELFGPRPIDLPPGERPPLREPGWPRPEGDRPRPEGDRPRPEGAGLEQLRARLSEADANKDGKWSKEEVPERMRENFDRIDANGDGLIDETELRTVFARLREGAGGRPERERQPDRLPERERPPQE
jgi:Ca2+-binding EF-hand superfamily protein